MMWNTGMGSATGSGMWLLVAVGTVAFWLAIVWLVREVFSSHEHARHRLRRGVDEHERHYYDRSDAHREANEGACTMERHRSSAYPILEPDDRDGRRSPVDVLEQRLARGEIDVDEYARIRRTLIESNPSLSRDVSDQVR